MTTVGSFGRLAFSFVIFLVFLAAFVSAWSWPFQARLLPWVVSIPGVALSLLQVLFDLSLLRRGEGSSGWLAHLAEETQESRGVLLGRAALVVAWIVGFFLSIWVIGFFVSAPLFIAAYLVVHGHERWWVVLIAAAVVLLFLFGLFEHFLHIPWPEPLFDGPQELLLRWLG